MAEELPEGLDEIYALGDACRALMAQVDSLPERARRLLPSPSVVGQVKLLCTRMDVLIVTPLERRFGRERKPEASKKRGG